MAGGKATYYAVLGVARDASATEIRSAWRRLSLERALARYLEIQEAYKVLSDRERKAMYDAGLRMQMQFDAATQNGADKEGRGPNNMDELTAMMDRMKTDSEESDGEPRPAAAGGAGRPGKKGSSSPSSPATVRIDLSVKFTPAAGTSRGGGPSGPRRPARPRKTMLDPVLGRKLRWRKD
ncbi:uncharacterized protein LOC101769594 [Setaria italica]|uniref:uncharacterized protein LOC101769594 n=1 Tax=Setaria italica TaxID=4555 RepID=UPI000350DF62|nr:uncharacterized protein LOC101769594 [Setaria italica]